MLTNEPATTDVFVARVAHAVRARMQLGWPPGLATATMAMVDAGVAHTFEDALAVALHRRSREDAQALQLRPPETIAGLDDNDIRSRGALFAVPAWATMLASVLESDPNVWFVQTPRAAAPYARAVAVVVGLRWLNAISVRLAIDAVIAAVQARSPGHAPNYDEMQRLFQISFENIADVSAEPAFPTEADLADQEALFSAKHAWPPCVNTRRLRSIDRLRALVESYSAGGFDEMVVRCAIDNA